MKRRTTDHWPLAAVPATLPPMKRLAFLFLVLPLLAACGVYKPLQIEPLGKATPISPRFGQSYYYYDGDQDLFFVMRSTGTDAVTGKAVDQIATIRVFWRPRGGVTTLNPSAVNATFRYVIMTPDAIGMYEGAGFVRLLSKTGDARFQARVLDGDLRLTQASASFVDTMGRAHLNGVFTATYDDAKAMDMLLDSQQEFFARSLNSKTAATVPATAAQPGAAGTMPATRPATMP